MSLFCCKLPQLPSGTGRSELAGLSTPRKVAAATAEGNLMIQITDVRTEGQRLFYALRMGHFYLFPPKNACNAPIFTPTAAATLSGLGLIFLHCPTVLAREKVRAVEVPWSNACQVFQSGEEQAVGSRADMMLVYSRHSFTLI